MPDDLPPVFFIFGQIDPNIGVDILVTRAVSTADTVYIRDLLVHDAIVDIVDEMGVRYSVPYQTNGKYLRDTTGLGLQPGKKYRIEANAPGLPAVQSAWVAIPENILPDTLSFRLDGGFNGDAPTGEGYLQFKPYGDLNSCYLLRMSGIIENLPPIRIGFGLEITQLCAVYLRNGDACFDNSCFGGNDTAKCLLHADAAHYFPDRNEQKIYQEIVFQFGAVSTEYRDYLFSLEQPEEWENGLIEPKPSYSNITGGWGIFFASNTTTRVVPL